VSEKRKAVVFGVKCTKCGALRYLKIRPAKGPYVCKRCRPAPSRTSSRPSPSAASPRDPFYTDAARREELEARERGGAWLPPRPDWLRR
jgi:hypothetical protein